MHESTAEKKELNWKGNEYPSSCASMEHSQQDIK